MSIFVNPTDTFNIDFFVGKSKNGEDIYCDPEEENLKSLNEDLDQATIEKHTCTFRRPSYHDSVSFADGAMEMIGGEIRLNPARADMRRIMTLLKSWSFKDAKGTPAATSEQNIANLAPEIAVVIAYLLDKKL